MLTNLKTMGMGLFLSMVALSASAQTVIDTTDAEAELAAGNAAIVAVGGAILVLAAIVAVYKWVSRSAR